MVPKYKVNILSKKQIVVFYGYYEEELNELFVSNPKNKLFEGIFSEKELYQIQQEEINVIFSEYLLDLDDDIYTIKLKIFLSFQ